MRNKKGLTVIELLMVIVIIIIFVFVGYCKIKTANTDYTDKIAETVAIEFPGAKFKILDSEFEDDDNDVEIDVLITTKSGKKFTVEFDCECNCFGDDNIRCRLDEMN